MPKETLDGIYTISVLKDEDFGPPAPGVEEDLDDLDLEEIGKVQIKGDQVTNLDPDNEDISGIIALTFVKQGKKVKTKTGEVYVDSQIPIKNGSPGFAIAFLETLAHYDYAEERVEE